MPWTDALEVVVHVIPWKAFGDGARRMGCAPSEQIPGSDGQLPYHSRFSDWYTAAAIRSRPPLNPSANANLLCFPLELAPVLQHPDVRSLDPRIQREGLMQHLFSYLTFTDRLEDEVVNRSARRIATGAADLEVSTEMRLDAYKIYCDEGYHSLFSAELMAQLAVRAAFTYDGGNGHPALSYFHARRASFDSATSRWFDLFFAIVSETLISASLLRIPRAHDVLPAVRQLVADHAADEWRHHAFFAHVCQRAWPCLPPHVRRVVGPSIPRCIMEFLGPDTPALLAFLERHVGAVRAADIVAASYSPAARRVHARAAARASLRVFEQAGLFEDAETADAFAEYDFSTATE